MGVDVRRGGDLNSFTRAKAHPPFWCSSKFQIYRGSQPHPCTSSPYWKGFYMKWKNLLLTVATDFLLEVNFFRRGCSKVVKRARTCNLIAIANAITWSDVQRRSQYMWFIRHFQTYHIGKAVPFNPSLAEHDRPCLSKQCRSRSVGFWRSQLIWICTVCH